MPEPRFAPDAPAPSSAASPVRWFEWRARGQYRGRAKTNGRGWQGRASRSTDVLLVAQCRAAQMCQPTRRRLRKTRPPKMDLAQICQRDRASAQARPHACHRPRHASEIPKFSRCAFLTNYARKRNRRGIQVFCVHISGAK